MRQVRDHCVRCGECCLRSSPTLHREDLHLVKRGLIGKRHLYTLRRGEAVRDNVKGGVAVIRKEMIKVREKPGGACILYDAEAGACTIYDQRPLQCAALKCWDTRDFMKVYEGPRLERSAVVEDETLMGFIEGHERRCAYRALERHVRRIPTEGEKAVEEVIRILRFDYHFRPAVAEKLGIEAQDMDFFFGRPLVDTISMFGIKVIRQPGGSFFLTRV